MAVKVLIYIFRRDFSMVNLSRPLMKVGQLSDTGESKGTDSTG